MTKEKLLVIDRDLESFDLMTYHFSREGFRVSCLEEGEEYFDKILSERPSLIIFDESYQEIPALEFCKRLKSDPRTRSIPQVFLSMNTTEQDVVRGLELGVDAYVKKPLRIKEFIARVKAILRRTPPRIAGDASSCIVHSGFELDMDCHRVIVKGARISFTTMEFKILRLLAIHAGRVFSREEILYNVVGSTVTISRRNIDVHIKAIREKLGDRSRYIETVRGVGYRFREIST